MPTHTFEHSCMAPFAPDAVYYMKCVPFTCVGLYGVLMYPSQVPVPTCSGESSAHWVSGFGVSGPADATGNNIAHWRHSGPCCTHNTHTHATQHTQHTCKTHTCKTHATSMPNITYNQHTTKTHKQVFVCTLCVIIPLCTSVGVLRR